MIIDQDFLKNVVKPNSMCSKEQISELNKVLTEIFDNNVDGDIIECGTWRGGLACMMLKTIIDNKSDKKLFVYDTFEGMAKPSDNDIDTKGQKASEHFKTVADETGETSYWCRAGIDIISSNLERVTNEYKDYALLIKGKVEDTLVFEENLPDTVSLMRLDTDWYQSTKVELETFYPRLSIGGMIIVDDYGHWQGQQKAVDEFFTNISEDSIKKTIGSNHSLIIEKLR